MRRRRRAVRLAALLAVFAATAGATAETGTGESLVAALAVERARPPAPRFERADFLVSPPVREVRLSPDGLRVAWLEGRPDDEATAPLALRLLDTTGGPVRTLVARTSFRSLHWSTDGRWIFAEEPERISRVAVSSAVGGAGSGVVVALGGPERRELLGIDPFRPAAVLVGEGELVPGTSQFASFRVVRIGAAGERELLHEGPHPVADVVLGRDGRIAFLRWLEGGGYSLARAVATGGYEVVRRCDGLETCALLGIADGGRAAWLRSTLGGERDRLLRLRQSGELETVHEDPRREADLDDLVFDPSDGTPWFASYRSRDAATYPLVPEARSSWSRLSRLFPGADLRLQLGRGVGARWLVEERGDRLQLPRWHLFDPSTGEVTALFAEAQRGATRLPESALSRRIPIDWRASDGRRLHGFLSVPPGRDLARTPLVARVHGGPWNHVGPGYDPWVQLLVGRGYAVFEPNFRGSTGFGRDYLLSAGQEFGAGRVQRDIVDGVRHLLSLRIGDPERVGIVGMSFGGYSALLGVTFDPELFRVAIAGAPPTDFGWTIRFFAERERPDRMADIPLATRLVHLKLDPADAALAERLRRDSPAANAERMRRPLLLLAGGKDDRVALRGVLDYAARLRAHGREVSLYVAPDEGHSPASRREREAQLTLVERMLYLHLGGLEPSPIREELAASMRRNLRIDSAGAGAGGLLAAASAALSAPRTAARGGD